MPFSMSEGFQHPVGTFKARIVDWEETEGQYGPQMIWRFDTGQLKPNGEPALLNYYTSMKFSTPETPAAKKTKLTQLCQALGVPIPRTVDEAEAFDKASLENIECMVSVQVGENSQYANIVSVVALPRQTARPAAQRPTAGQQAPRPAQRGAVAVAEPEVDVEKEDPFEA